MTTARSTIFRTAEFSSCGRYRWRLGRRWSDSPSPRILGWIMLNPSTADGDRDDPTIRRCVAFARRRGFGGIEVRNLFCFRATDPRELHRAADPIGSEANHLLMELLDVCQKVVAAWGAHGSLRGRDTEVVQLLQRSNATLHCLGRTLAGHPRHPLYIPANFRLRRFV